jgi:TldD protein
VISARAVSCLILVFLGVARAQQPNLKRGAILQAMLSELDRSRALRIVNLDPPYYIEYAVEDGSNFSLSATLGAIIDSSQNRYRLPRVDVRVGSYRFDDTNYIFSGFFSRRRAQERLPLDDDPLAIRHALWLATDSAYKGAVAAISRKRAALKNVNVQEDLPDFSKADRVELMQDQKKISVDEALWTDRVKKLSAIFADYPKVMNSEVEFQVMQSLSYFANTEGTVTRTPDVLTYLRVKASGQAPDGMILRDAAVTHAFEPGQMPSEAELRRLIQDVGTHVTALAAAPVGETYSGPILFAGQASAQLFAQVLGDNLAVPRRPIPEPGRPAPFEPSELEGRLGSRILPEWMNVVDDPTQKEWRGRLLLGHYPVDMEGVVPIPLTLVEKGILKGFLLTRQPVRGQEGSNGRARLPGRFGAKSALFGNLFIQASETVSSAELKKKMMDLVRQRNKPYGMLIRKLDFPASASIGELRRLAARESQRGDGRVGSVPLLAYRVYPDGREELVRGLEFRGLSVRSLRDIIAASDDTSLFEFMANTAPLSLMGVGGYVAPCAVVAPSVLFEDLELQRTDEELPKLPVVPPPKLAMMR